IVQRLETHYRSQRVGVVRKRLVSNVRRNTCSTPRPRIGRASRDDEGALVAEIAEGLLDVVEVVRVERVAFAGDAVDVLLTGQPERAVTRPDVVDHDYEVRIDRAALRVDATHEVDGA